MRILAGFPLVIADVESLNVGVALRTYFDVSKNKTGLPTAAQVARTIHEQIRSELRLTASAGRDDTSDADAPGTFLGLPV